MLNKLWAFMIMIGIICGALMHRSAAVTKAALEGAQDGISLCITMAGVVALWMGLMEIAKESGLVERMTKGIAPFLYFLFPKIPKGHPSLSYIATNVIANVLGLGWACTPAGLKAMEALAELEKERGNPEYGEAVPDDLGDANSQNEMEQHENSDSRRASTEMCTFLILNISSLQLVPVSMIAYRSQYGSDHPAAILVPAILATLVSTIVAILFCKWMEKRQDH